MFKKITIFFAIALLVISASFVEAQGQAHEPTLADIPVDISDDGYLSFLLGEDINYRNFIASTAAEKCDFFQSQIVSVSKNVLATGPVAIVTEDFYGPDNTRFEMWYFEGTIVGPMQYINQNTPYLVVKLSNGKEVIAGINPFLSLIYGTGLDITLPADGVKICVWGEKQIHPFFPGQAVVVIYVSASDF